MPISKPNLNPTILKDHGITYDVNIIASRPDDSVGGSNEDTRLPDHVESVRGALLDFGRPLPRTIRDEFERECETHGIAELPPDSVYYDDQTLPRRSCEALAAAAKADFDENAEIAEEARRLQSCDVSEDEWALFMRAHIFKRYKDVFPSPSPKLELFDKWALESNILWNEARVYVNSDYRLKQRTDPKPDLTYGFPINDTTSNLFRREEAVENFSLEVLAKLRQNELISSPQTSLLTWAHRHRKNLNQPGLLCFPWAIVELKPAEVQKSSGRFCYCQAANGASAALKIYEELSSRARGELDDKVPPVVAFTCIGPKIRVWLAYSCTKDSQTNCHKMVCIWASTLAATWGVMATRLIVSNMHFWASRVLRPKISNYLSQVRMSARLAVDPGPSGASPSRPMLVNDEPPLDISPPQNQVSACSLRTIPATESQATDLLAESMPPTSANRPGTPPVNMVLPETSPASVPLLSQSADRPTPSEQPAARMPGSSVQSRNTEVDDPIALTTPRREGDTGRLAPTEPQTTKIEDRDTSTASYVEGNTSPQSDDRSVNEQTSNIQNIVDNMRGLSVSQDAAANSTLGTPTTRELATNTAWASNLAIPTLVENVSPPDVPHSTTLSSSAPATSMLAFGTSATGRLSFCTSNLNEPQAFIGPGTENFPFVPYIGVEGSGISAKPYLYQNITFQEPYRTESCEELRLADYQNNRKGGNAAMASNVATGTASTLISNQPPSTDPAAIELINDSPSASMESPARPFTSPPNTNISVSDTAALVSAVAFGAFGARATSKPATSAVAMSSSLMSTSSGNASSESTLFGIRPSENMPAATAQCSQAWDQESDRREENVEDVEHAAREMSSVASPVEQEEESEHGYDSSEHLDDEGDLDDEERSDDERHNDDENEESDVSPSNHRDDEPRRLWADDLLDARIVNEIIDTLSEPGITVRFSEAAEMQRYVFRHGSWDRWRCEPLDNIYNYLNGVLNLSARDGITYEKVGTEHWGIRRLFARAIRMMRYSDRRCFAELLWQSRFFWDGYRLRHLELDYDIPRGLHVRA